MANYNVSVTQSIELQPSNIGAGVSTTYIIDNPLDTYSYFTLETVPDPGETAYTSTSPKNCVGTFTTGSGLSNILQDDYKTSVVVAPGGGNLTFIPTNAIVASSFRLRGVGA